MTLSCSRHGLFSVVAFATVTGTLPLAAQDLVSTTQIHAYGGWAYGRTNGNTVDLGSRIGDYKNFNFATVVSAQPSDKVYISSQLEANEEDGETVVELGYALAEYRISDALRVRLGRVKQPFGLYTELYYVGTYRPFFSLPQSIYGPVGVVSEWFQGASLSGGRSLGKRWSFDCDAYGGAINVPDVPPLAVANDSLNEEIDDVVGGRCNLHAGNGVSFGASGYTGHIPQHGRDRHHAALGSFEYAGSSLLIRSEYAYRHEIDENLNAAYVEVAYSITPAWQVALRGDGSNTTFREPEIAAIPHAGEYREQAVSLNRWLTPTFVIKGSVHRTTGARFALPKPDADGDIVPGALPTRETTLALIGAQVAF